MDKLNKHLIAPTRPIALKDNMVFFDKYRISVLKERLFRIEYNENKNFNDLATTAIWYRDLPPVDFVVLKNKDSVSIVTDKVTLNVNVKYELSYVLLNNLKVSLDNSENLLGTASGLDGCEAEINKFYPKQRPVIILDPGVCAKNGVAVLNDATSQCFDNDGILIDPSSDSIDDYVFAYGLDYQQAVKEFYEIAGKAPMLPKFVFGNWWSRYHAYTDDEYLLLLDKFEKYNVPLTVATLDMDWHYSTNMFEDFKIKENKRDSIEYGFDYEQPQWMWGWTGYSWNKNLFKDEKAFLSKVHDRGLQVTLNLHPNTICWYEDRYPKMAKYMGLDPSSNLAIPLDFKSAKLINGYFDIMHHDLEDDGVDFWWIDDTRYDLAHYHFLDSGRKHAPLVLTRYTGIGSHRYPLGFSGDSVISWKSLEYLPYFTITASNIGYTWWSHDIGGFMAGVKDDELFLRYVQFGVFLPILRLHCQSSEMYTKEPWTYCNGIGNLAMDSLRLRHRLIPFNYSGAYRTYKEGLALMEPLYYYYPKDKRSYKFKNEYIYNGQLLVSPITAHSSKMGMSECKVFLPKGRWVDIFTNDEYEGGRVTNMVRWLDSIPCLAKQGAIIVLDNDKVEQKLKNPTSIEIDAYLGNGNFTLYEQDDNKNELITMIESVTIDNKMTLKLSFDNAQFMDKNRTFKVCFKNIYKGKVLSNCSKSYIDDYLIVEISNVNFNKELVVEVEFEKESKLEMFKRQAKYNIHRMQGDNTYRSDLYEKLINCSDVESFVNIVTESKIPTIYKKRLLEQK